jgi:hypothetical protein
LLEWFAQSERLNIARTHYKMHGTRFVDFARRIGVDRASAYHISWLSCGSTGQPFFAVVWTKDATMDGKPASTGLSAIRVGGTLLKLAITPTNTAPPQVYSSGSVRHAHSTFCATADKAMCATFFTKEQDGLKQAWHGTVWLNPPYSHIHPWCQKAYEYARAGGAVPAWTDAPWFHDVASYGRITFIRGKLSFIGRKGYVWFPSMIVEWNPTTVRRLPGAPLNTVLDTGSAKGGNYIP